MRPPEGRGGWVDRYTLITPRAGVPNGNRIDGGSLCVQLLHATSDRTVSVGLHYYNAVLYTRKRKRAHSSTRTHAQSREHTHAQKPNNVHSHTNCLF